MLQGATLPGDADGTAASGGLKVAALVSAGDLVAGDNSLSELCLSLLRRVVLHLVVL